MSERKRFWRCHVCNDIHYGLKPPEVCPTCGMRNAFVLCSQREAGKIVELARDKAAFRCPACGDLHLGAKALPFCPSCGSGGRYAGSEREELVSLAAPADPHPYATEEVLSSWEDFVARNGRIKLWEDRASVQQLSVGVLENDQSKGLKYCPCRVPTGDQARDLKLICPCNFLAQQTWKEYGECWCGLFRKR